MKENTHKTEQIELTSVDAYWLTKGLELLTVRPSSNELTPDQVAQISYAISTVSGKIRDVAEKFAPVETQPEETNVSKKESNKKGK